MSSEIVTQFKVGERLDKTLAKLYPQYSRSAIEKLIENGQVTVNNQPIKSKYITKENDSIEVDFDTLDRAPEQIELPTIYEDENVVVINKPVGILAHTKGALSKEGTVASWLKDHLHVILSEAEGSSARTNNSDPSTDTQDDKASDEPRFWNSNRAGIVHRLDRGTSGVMIVAKNEDAQKFLQKQFAKRNVKKTYVAVINGELPEKEGFIDVPIERNPKKPATFRAGINGKPAQTEFKTLATHEQQTYSLIQLKPKTGRTHQLRVHLAYLKHPIVGDGFYNGESAERLLLHAEELEITLPNSERKVFTAAIPKIFTDYVK